MDEHLPEVLRLLPEQNLFRFSNHARYSQRRVWLNPGELLIGALDGHSCAINAKCSRRWVDGRYEGPLVITRPVRILERQEPEREHPYMPGAPITTIQYSEAVSADRIQRLVSRRMIRLVDQDDFWIVTVPGGGGEIRMSKAADVSVSGNLQLVKLCGKNDLGFGHSQFVVVRI